MYRVVCILLDTASTIFFGCCLKYYFDAFMERKSFFRQAGGAWLVASYFTADVLLGFLFKGDYESRATIGKFFAVFLILFLLAKIFYMAENQMVLFLSVTFVAIKDICAFIAMLIAVWGGRLFDLWLVLLKKGRVSSINTFEHLLEGTAILLQALMYAACAIIFFSSLRAVIKNYKDRDYRIRREELLFILIPAFAGFLLCILLRTILITIDGNVPQSLYDKYPLLMAVVPAISFLALLSIIYSVRLFQDMISLNKEKSNRVILEKQLGNMQEHIEEMERIYAGIRSMKHDMNNTLSVIMQLAVNDESRSDTELQAYLSELNQTMDKLEFRYRTGNSVVDILLNMKYHEMVRTMPKLQLNAEALLFPEGLRIQSYDIGIILGNALDNAIEACRRLVEKEKDADAFIRLSSFQRGKMFFIEVCNSFDGKILRKKHSEFPMTDKPNQKTHGIGLINIKNTAEQYHGGVDWAVENNKFTLTVMLQDEKKQ